MHIPDSAISPMTSIAANAAMLPIWYTASRRLRSSLTTRQVPLLSLGAAFSFTIMMFNIPAPGGTTVHPIGGVLMAVALGPWAAVIGVTVALAIQALFFADGGVLAIGANCFAMAFAMPCCGSLVYRLIAGRSATDSPRRALAAGIGAYVGLNVAALLVALFLGIQPAFYRDADGKALYFPFGLNVTLPAIMSAHLTIAGAAEAIVTALAVRYIQKARIPLYAAGDAAASGGRLELLWVGLGALIALSPLGMLATGDAWGEWSKEDLAKQAGYLPRHLDAIDETGWKGFQLLPDYLSERGAGFYIAAALVGALMITLMLYAVGRLLAQREEPPAPPPDETPPPSSSRPGDLPPWMTETDQESRPGASAYQAIPSRTGRRAGFVERTLTELASSAQEILFAERWAQQKGMLQRLDGRIKVIGLLGLVVVTGFLHGLASLLGLFALSLILAVCSRLPVGMFLRRVWLTVPLSISAVTLPASLNLVTPGAPLITLWRDPYLAVTQPGLEAALLLTIRVGVAVSFVVLLTLTTRWNDLLHGLRALLIPRIFISVLAMTYRYLAALIQSAAEMFTARKSRSVGRMTREEHRRFLGGVIGALLGRTLALTEEVHAAMLSRGWTGEAHTLHVPRIQAADVLWLTALTLIAAFALMMERLLG
jgi:cobalt/nickel transport system permease protein